MISKLRMQISAGLGFLAVALGAFGAHGLQSILTANQAVDTWETAVFYHFVHVIIMFVISGKCNLRGAWCCFLIGILIFSGSLYVLSVTGWKFLGAITPLGGFSLLAGWAWLVIASRKLSSTEITD